MPQSLYEWVWIFLIYAFLGWAVEEVFHAVRMGKFVNRGFLNGPWCPIYGFGMLLVIIFLYPLRGNLVLLFLGSTVLLTLLEFVTGFVLNHVFHSRWWDYSDKPLQFGGYICLQFSLCWGVAGTAVILLIQEPIAGLVRVFPKLPGEILEGIFVALFVLDCCLTLFTVLKLTQKVRVLDDLSQGLRKMSNDIGEDLYKGTENVAQTLSSAGEVFEENAEAKKEVHEEKRQERERKRKLIYVWKEGHKKEWEDLHAAFQEASKKHVFGERRLMEAFPNVKFTDRNETLQKYKKHLIKRGEGHGSEEN